MIMLRLSENYNLEVVKHRYKYIYGFVPPYALDLIESSKELTEETNKLLDEMLKEPKYLDFDNEDIFAGWE